MDRVGGDLELLAALITAFNAELPRMLSDVKSGVASADAEALSRAAHALKGSVSTFSRGGAYRHEAELEEMGQKRRLDRARDTLAKLNDEIQSLSVELRALVA